MILIILSRILGRNSSNAGYWQGTDPNAVKVAWYGNENSDYARIHFLNLENNPDSLQSEQKHTIEQVNKINFNNGNANIDGTLDVSGNTTLSDLSCNNNVTIDGTLDVSGNTTLSDLSCNNNVTIDGSLDVSEVHISNNLEVTDVLIKNKLDVSNSFILPRRHGGNYVKDGSGSGISGEIYYDTHVNRFFGMYGNDKGFKELGGGSMSNSGNISILSLDKADNYSNTDTSGIYFFIDTKEGERSYEKAVMKLEKDTTDNVTLSIEGDISCNDTTFCNSLKPTGRISVDISGEKYFIRFKNIEDESDYLIKKTLDIYDSNDLTTPIDLTDVSRALLTIKDTSGAIVKDAGGRNISDVVVTYSESVSHNIGHWQGTDPSAVKVAWHRNENPDNVEIYYENLESDPLSPLHPLGITVEYNKILQRVVGDTGKLSMVVDDVEYSITFNDPTGNEYNVDTDLNVTDPNDNEYQDNANLTIKNVDGDYLQSYDNISQELVDINNINVYKHEGELFADGKSMWWTPWTSGLHALRFKLKNHGDNNMITLVDFNLHNSSSPSTEINVEVWDSGAHESLKNDTPTGRISVYISGEQYFIRLKNIDDESDYYIDDTLKIYDSSGLDTHIDLSYGFEAKITIKDMSGAVVGCKWS